MLWKRLKGLFAGQDRAREGGPLDELRGLLLSFPAQLGLYAIHLDTDQTIDIRGSTPFFLGDAARMIPALATLAQLKDPAELEQSFTLGVEDYRGERGHLGWQALGRRLTLKELLEHSARHGDLLATDRLDLHLGPGGARSVISGLSLTLAHRWLGVTELCRMLLSREDTAWAGLPPHAYMPWLLDGIEDHLPPTTRPALPDRSAPAWTRQAMALGYDHVAPREIAQLLVRLLKGEILAEPWKRQLMTELLLTHPLVRGGIEPFPGLRLVQSAAPIWPTVHSLMGAFFDEQSEPFAVIVLLADQVDVGADSVRVAFEKVVAACAAVLGLPRTTLAFKEEGPRIEIEPLSTRVCYERGDAPELRWRSQQIKGPLELSLVRTAPGGGTQRVELLAPHLKDDGAFSAWQVPPSLAPGDDYRFQIRDLGQEGVVTHSAPFVVGGVIKVLQPSGEGEALPGQPLPISWETLGVEGKVLVELVRGSVSVPIAGPIADTGRFDGFVLGDLPPGDDYLVHVESVDEPGVEGWSRPFNVGGRLSWIAPSGGEHFLPGRPATLRWVGSPAAGAVRISLLRGTEQVVAQVAGRVEEGTFTWDLPSDLPAGAGYHLLLEEQGPRGRSALSAPFTVGPRLGWITPGVEQAPVERSAHTRRTLWSYGQTPAIRWESAPPSGGQVKVELLREMKVVEVLEEAADADGSLTTLVQRRWEVGSDYRLRLHWRGGGLTTLSPPFQIGACVDVERDVDPEDVDTGQVMARWRCTGIGGGIELRAEDVHGHLVVLASRLPPQGEWEGPLPSAIEGLWRLRAVVLGTPDVTCVSGWYRR